MVIIPPVLQGNSWFPSAYEDKSSYVASAQILRLSIILHGYLPWTLITNCWVSVPSQIPEWNHLLTYLHSRMQPKLMPPVFII